jgi:hypothetical protein
MLSAPALAQNTLLSIMYEGDQCSGKPVGAVSTKIDLFPCKVGGCTVKDKRAVDQRCTSDFPEAAVNKALGAESSDPFWTVVAYGDDKCSQPFPIPTAFAVYPTNKLSGDQQ